MKANSSKLAVTAILLVTIVLAFSSAITANVDAGGCGYFCKTGKTGHTGKTVPPPPITRTPAPPSSYTVIMPAVLVVRPKTVTTTTVIYFPLTFTITLQTATVTLVLTYSYTPSCSPFDIGGIGGIEESSATTTLYSTLYTTTVNTATSVTSTFTTLTANTITTTTTTTVQKNSTATGAGNGAGTAACSCPISLATFGSVLAPVAQAMRNFRDQSILKTKVGADFMTFFNAWYYSFSPTLASHFERHPTQRALFRDALYPLFGILYASYYSYLILSPLGSEPAAATAGIVAAGLIGVVYFTPVVYLTSRLLRRKFRSLKLAPSRIFGWMAISAALTGFAYSTGGLLPLSIATINLVLSSLTVGCILGVFALTRLTAGGAAQAARMTYFGLQGFFMKSQLRELVRRWF